MKATQAWMKWTYLSGFALLLLLAAIGVKVWTTAQQASPLQTVDRSVIVTTDSAPASVETRPDVFQQAVDYAEQAAPEGQLAQTVEQWQQVAQLWRNAAMVLNQVPRSSSYYELAHQKFDTLNRYGGGHSPFRLIVATPLKAAIAYTRYPQGSFPINSL